MKRDFAVIRKLLFKLEDMAGNADLTESMLWISKPGEGRRSLLDERDFYHLRLMIQGGLIEGEERYGEKGPGLFFKALTSLGQDFLDSVRDEVVWKAVWDKVEIMGGSAPFHIWQTLAEKECWKRLERGGSGKGYTGPKTLPGEREFA